MKTIRNLIITSIVLFIMFSQITFSWTGPTRLTWNSSESSDPVLVIEPGIHSNKMHVVWEDDIPGNFEIYYKKSTDGGSTWSTPQRLTYSAGDSTNAAMIIDDKLYLHLVYQDSSPGNHEIFYKRSTDGGANWSYMKRLTYTSSYSFHPDITYYPTKLSNNAIVMSIHIVWSENIGIDFEIFHKSFLDLDTAWGTYTTKRMTWNSGWSTYPKITADSQKDLHLVWQDNTPGNYEIFYKRSTDGGYTWTMERLTWNSGWSGNPTIATDPSDNIYLAWDDDTPGNSEIFFKGCDGITPWGPVKRLTWNSGDSYNPYIIAFKTLQPHIVWYDNSPGNYDIFYKMSTNGGNAWPAPTRLTYNSGYSHSPVIDLDYQTENVHVSWSDNTPGNYEIYYKKKIAPVT